jgi:hypothetical protein
MGGSRRANSTETLVLWFYRLILAQKEHHQRSILTLTKPVVRWLSPFLLLLLITLIPSRLSISAVSEEKPASRNTILNGDLVKGNDEAPEFWNTRAYKKEPRATIYRWNHTGDAPASLEILSTEANDARWEQNVRLAPGWYFFTAELRTEDVGPGGTGGCLSLIDHGVFVSHELRGTTDWQKVGFYLKAAQPNDTADLACRLGGFGALNTGRLFCRQFDLSKIAEPPDDGLPRFDLAAIRSQVAQSPAANDKIWATFLIGVACAVLVIVLIGQPRLGNLLRRLQVFLATQRKQSSLAVDSIAPPIGTSRFIDEWGTTLAAVAGAIVLALLAIRRLDGSPYEVNFGAAVAGIQTLLPITGIAAIKLWSFWALGSLLLAAVLLQSAPELDVLDALLAGAGGVWVIAYLVGQVLGPVGLFRPLAIWGLVGVGVIQIARRPPAIARRRTTTGEKCALLAVALLAIGMLPLQLGSPVPPYMDVLSYPASVERILAFKVYLPFDNDPFGCWGARAQTPALELFYAALAIGAHVTQGILACSALMLPMAALVIFATYRLGLTLAGDSLGGIAALFLFFTNMFRRLPGMRGTAVDFALVALGLAFFFDRRRSRALLALGSILLGTSVAGHAINGASAMLIAGLGSFLFLFDRDSERFAVSIVCLVGAALFAWPEVMIGLGKAVVYPVLPIIQIAGIAIVVAGVRGLNQRKVSTPESLHRTALPFSLLLAISVIYIYFATKGWIFEELWHEFPILSLLALAGMLAWVLFTDPRLSTGSIIVVIALSEAMVYLGASMVMTTAGGDIFRSGFADIGLKLEQYWCPYFMVFPASIPFALLHQHWRKGRPLLLFGLLILLIYPWYERFHVDYDYNEHSIAENWGIDLSTASGGFWVTTGDSRWTLDSSGFALVDFLRDEQAKGRVTTQTHVLHLTHDVTPLGEFNRFAVFTGINDDPVVYDIPITDVVYGYLAGSRVRKVSDWSRALAERPPYILEQVNPPPGLSDYPIGYDEVFHQGALRLFRRKGS